MIILHLAMNGDKVIALLEGYDGGDYTFKFEGKKGIQHHFAVTGDVDGALAKAKSLIKGETWGTNMYFSATKE